MGTLRILFCAAIFSLGFSTGLQAADQPLIFATAPTHSTDKTLEIYQPVIDYLRQKTGQEIIIQTAATFTDYNNNIQNNSYQIVFDGPHYVGWRVDKFGHVPIARLPGQIKIAVVIKKDSKIGQLEQLVGKRVCTFPSPNMLTMAFLENFPNPIRQPVLVPAQGFKGLEQCLNRDDVVGAVIRDKMWGKMANKDNLAIMFITDKTYPERTFSVSSDVDLETRRNITYALLSDEGQQHLKKVFTTFKKDRLIPAKPEEYTNLGNLLKPVWGFYN